METSVTVKKTTPNKKVKGLRMPYEKTWAQAIILFVVIFCLVFSFLPLFLTLVNAFKLDDQVKVDAFSLPLFSTISKATSEKFLRDFLRYPRFWRLDLWALWFSQTP